MTVNYSTKFKIQSQEGNQLQYKPHNSKFEEVDLNNMIVKKYQTGM